MTREAGTREQTRRLIADLGREVNLRLVRQWRSLSGVAVLDQLVPGDHGD